ncbi:hypothetical protein SDC9_107524 [bioreactor metagenome]|uniref:Uncharacterized protein n=1 Tax=bioreactor metagenome TaxID=1076179 RepID=A0A645B5H5_9ZZZZ
MLGLQRAVVAEDDIDHVVGERLVAGRLRPAGELLVEHEVDVAVLGVAEDHRVLVAVPDEQLGELGTGPAQRADRHHDVLEQSGRATRPVAGDGRVQTLADGPQLGGPAGVLGHPEGHRQRQLVGHRPGGGDPVGQLLGGVPVELDQQCRVVLDLQVGDRPGAAGQCPGDPQADRVHQLDRREPGRHQVGQCRHRRVDGPEHHQAGGDRRQHLDGAQGRLRDEAERALRTDHQVGQDLDRAVVVEERVQPVAHGVLHRELLADRVDRVPAGPDPVAQAVQPGVEGGLEPAQLLVGVRDAGVDHRARGQHQHHGLERPVGVELGAAGHPGGVVGDHATDRAGDLGSRVGTDLATVRAQRQVHRADGRARLHPDPDPVVEDLDAAEVRPGVGEDAAALGLSGQAGAAGAEGQWQAAAAGRTEQRADVVGGPGGGHDLRDDEVVGGVMGQGTPVELTRGVHPGRTEEGGVVVRRRRGHGETPDRH